MQSANFEHGESSAAPAERPRACRGSSAALAVGGGRLASGAPPINIARMKATRGLDVTADNAAAVAAADDFAARLLRLDQGVEAILDAVKRWPATPIVRLYAAAFWLYGQTEDARVNAATHLREGATLAKASHLTGYASEASFSQAFRQWAGVAPGAYRKQLREPSSGDD